MVDTERFATAVRDRTIVPKRRRARVRRRMRWYVKLMLGMAVVLLLLGIGLVITFQEATRPENVRALIDDALGDLYAGEHEVRSASFTIEQGLVVRDVSLMRTGDPTAPLYERGIAQIPEIRVELDWLGTIANVLSFEFVPALNDVIIDEPTLWLRFDSEGVPIDSGLFQTTDSDSTGRTAIPPITIRNATVYFQYPPIFADLGDNRFHVITNLNVQLSQDLVDRRYLEASGAATLEPWGAIGIAGRVQTSADEIRLNVATQNFRIDTETVARLAPEIQNAWLQYRAELLADIDAEIVIQPDQPLGLALQLAVFDGSIAYRDFPIPVSGVFGVITVTNYPPNPFLPLQAPEHSLTEPAMALHFPSRPADTPTPIEGSPITAPLAGERASELGLGFRDPALLTMTDEALVAYIAQGQPLRVPSGKFQWVQIHIRAAARGGFVALDADLRELGANPEVDGFKPREVITVTADNAVVDKSFHRHLLDSPNVNPGIKQVFHDYDPYGRASALFVAGSIEERLVLTMHDTIGTYAAFPVPLQQATGSIEGMEQNWSARNISGVVGATGSELTIDVDLDLARDTAPLVVRVSGSNIVIDDAFLGAMPPLVRNILLEHRVRGVVDLDLGFFWQKQFDPQRARQAQIDLSATALENGRDLHADPIRLEELLLEQMPDEVVTPKPGWWPSDSADASDEFGDIEDGQPEPDAPLLYDLVIRPRQVQHSWKRLPLDSVITAGTLRVTSEDVILDGITGEFGDGTTIVLDGKIGMGGGGGMVGGFGGDAEPTSADAGANASADTDAGGGGDIDLTVRATNIDLAQVRQTLVGAADPNADESNTDAPLIEPIPGAAERAELVNGLWEDFQPDGRANFVYVQRSRGLPQVEISLTLLGASLTYHLFPAPMIDVRGTVYVTQTGDARVIRLDNLTARYKDATVRLSGSITGEGDDVNVAIHVDARNVPLDDQIHAAFDALEKTWREGGMDLGGTGAGSDDGARSGLSPRDPHPQPLSQGERGAAVPSIREQIGYPTGRVDVVLDIVPTGDPDEPMTTVVEVTLRGVSGEPAFFPYALEDLTGTVVIDAPEIDLWNVRGRHRSPGRSDDTEVHLISGHFEPGRFVADIVVTNLDTGEDARAALPPNLQPLVDLMRVQGQVDLVGHIDMELEELPTDYEPSRTPQPQPRERPDSGDTIRQFDENDDVDRVARGTTDDAVGQAPDRDAGDPDAVATAEADEPLTTRFNGYLRLRGAGVTIGVPLSDIHGILGFNGVAHGDDFAMTMDARIDRGEFAGVRMHGGHVQGQLYRDRLRVSSLTARAYDGWLEAAFEMDLTPPIEGGLGYYEGYARWVRVDVGRALKEIFPGSVKLKGLLDGELSFFGWATDPEGPKGEGRIDIVEGELLDVPVLLKLLDFANYDKPTPWDEAHALFTLMPRAQGLRITDMLIVSDAAAVSGAGNVTFDARVDLRVFVDLAPRTRMIPPPLYLLKRGIESLVPAYITGPVTDVQISILLEPDRTPRRPRVRPEGAPYMPDVRPREWRESDPRRPLGHALPERD